MPDEVRIDESGNLIIPKSSPEYERLAAQLKPQGFTPSIPEKEKPLPERIVDRGADVVDAMVGQDGVEGQSLAERALTSIRSAMKEKPKVAPGTPPDWKLESDQEKAEKKDEKEEADEG